MNTSVGSDFETDAAPWPIARIAWWTVGVMMATAFICTMDRLVLNLLVDSIRGELHITDVQISLLQGLSFTVVNALAALPLGLLADKTSRRFLMIAGVLIWSTATIAGGLAVTFDAFFFARMFVGLGEAALWPVAVSMIGDVMPAARRGRAISLVLLGQILGSGASLILTGVVVKLVLQHHFQGLPVLGGLAPWRVVLVLWGLLGVPVILMLLSLPEPARREIAGAGIDFGGLRRFGAYIALRWRVLSPMFVAAAFVAVGVYALTAWGPTFFIRRFGFSQARLGPILGLIGIGGGILGTLLAGFVGDRLQKQGRPEHKLTVLMIATLACAPVALLSVAPNPPVAFAIQGLSLMCFPITGALSMIVLQDLIPNDMRGKAASIFTLVSSMVGGSLGPLLTALVTQHIFVRSAMVGYSIATVLVPSMLGAALCFFLVQRALKTSGPAA